MLDPQAGRSVVAVVCHTRRQRAVHPAYPQPARAAGHGAADTGESGGYAANGATGDIAKAYTVNESAAGRGR